MQKILLVGAGNMGEEYARVLKELKFSFDAVGRSKSRSDNFSKKFECDCFNNGLINPNIDFKKYSHAIVAAPIQELKPICQILISNGIKTILVEKPGGLNSFEITELNGYSANNQANIFVAYNRRFYASVLEAERIIKNDGGLLSCNFEFTEWSHVIEKLETPKIVKENWFLANSSHVVDLVFHLIGNPIELFSFTSGKTTWFEPSIFAGSGISEKNVLFNYGSNWNSAGRWRVELLTQKRKLILCPLEILQEQKIGTVEVGEIENIDYSLDKQFKPGLFNQTKSFLTGDVTKLKSLPEHVKSLGFYDKMEGRN
jgi:predicted dehydrogenase